MAWTLQGLRSPADGYPLIRLYPLAFHAALAVGQDDFDIALVQLAQAEVSDRFLA